MRITMNMTTNKMLMNINRNAVVVDKLYNQLTTGKKIQYPSDDPIIASRALKFRTNIAETEQYQRNVAQGLSWMEITEAGFTNVNDILEDIRTLCVKGGDDMEVSDRHKILMDIKLKAEQIGTEMNIDYAGRYVFSGYRTNEPPVFTENNKCSFDITQELTLQDMEKTRVYMKLEVGAEPVVYEDTTRLKLPYTDVTGLTMTAYDKANPPNTVAIPLTTMHLNDATLNPTPPPAPLTGYTTDYNPYNPQPGEAYYIPETGEIILAKDVVDQLNATAQGKIELTYTKAGYSAGEPNPKVYFNCNQTLDEYGQPTPPLPLQYYMTDATGASTQAFQFEFGANTRITVNNLAKDSLTASLYADLRSFYNELLSVKLSTEEEIRTRLTAPGSPFAGNPTAVPPIPPATSTEIDELVAKQLTEENKKYSGVMESRFSNMLAIIDRHAAEISAEHTLLSARMNRLDLIEVRLEENKVSYTKLKDENENVDYLEAIMRFNSAQAVYQAALMSGGKIMQLSLADYIR